MHVSVIRCPMAAHDACALPTLVLRVHVGVSARTRVRVPACAPLTNANHGAAVASTRRSATRGPETLCAQKGRTRNEITSR